MKNYKVLIATPFLSDKPLRGYETITLAIVEDLIQNGYQVDLISFDSDKKRKFNKNILNNKINKLLLIKISFFQRLYNVLTGFFKGESIQISYFKGSYSDESKVFNYVRKEDYDLMISITIRMARFLSDHNSCAYKVLHLVDPHILNYSKSNNWENFFFKFIYSIDYSRLFMFENNILKQFDLRTLLSNEDIKDMTLLYGLSFEKLTYGSRNFLGDFINLDFEKRDKNMLVITGNMSYKPNVVGVEWFCTRVFPLFLEHYPLIRLYVIGSNPPKRLLKLRGNNIIFTGYIENLTGFLSNSFVSICPVNHRIGVQTKILEAFAQRIPVISTSNSNSGINAVNFENILIADTAEEFLNHYIFLLIKSNWDLITKNSYNLFLNNFNLNKNIMNNNLMILDRIKTRNHNG